MLFRALREKTAPALGWLASFILIQFSLFVWAACNPSLLRLGSGNWETRDAVMAISMCLLILAAVLMHKLDGRYGHWGFLDVYRNKAQGSSLERDEQRFVGPVLTVESIRAAMTAVLLAILVDNRKIYLERLQSTATGGPKVDPDWHALESVIVDPATVLYLVVAGSLALSLVTTMAGLLCYEYATKFAWRRKWPRESLLWKAHWFGVWGFYCLMWSLAVIPALMDYQLAFLTITAVFIVMWLYYFFPPKDATTTAKLVLLYPKRSTGEAVSEETWTNHTALLKAVPHVCCVEVSIGPVDLETGSPSEYQAVAVLSFESKDELHSGLASAEGAAMKTDIGNVSTSEATLLTFEDKRG